MVENKPGANSIVGAEFVAKAAPDGCIEPVGNTPDQAGKFLEDEIAKWAKVINAAGVKAE